MATSALLASALEPEELYSLFALKFNSKGLVKRTKKTLFEQRDLHAREFCYVALTKVSRSFAVVIQKLPEELRDPICVFYLVLRGLDTVEDDMAINLDVKLPLLHSFYEKIELDDFSVDGVGYDDERVLLNYYGKVVGMYKSLDQKYRDVIKHVCREMGGGMAKFAKNKIVSITTTEQYDEYCHYVAGLVGIGLTQMFVVSLLEGGELDAVTNIANSMGLFLQKTNIIRDYLEDMEEGRTWWPQDIWGRHSQTLEWFAKNPNSEKSVLCLNDMISDALRLLPECLEYMSMIRDPHIFQFCAVPQVMAIATLAQLYNNENVFKRTVKIRKGLSAKLMLQTTDLVSFSHYIHFFCTQIKRQIQRRPSLSQPKTEELVNEIISDTSEFNTTFQHRTRSKVPLLSYSLVFFMMVLMFSVMCKILVKVIY